MSQFHKGILKTKTKLFYITLVYLFHRSELKEKNFVYEQSQLTQISKPVSKK